MDCGDLQVRSARDGERGFIGQRVALWELPVIWRRPVHLRDLIELKLDVTR